VAATYLCEVVVRWHDAFCGCAHPRETVEWSTGRCSAKQNRSFKRTTQHYIWNPATAHAKSRDEYLSGLSKIGERGERERFHVWIHSWNHTSARGVAHDLGVSCSAKNNLSLSR
jgi:hypothetical protein